MNLEEFVKRGQQAQAAVDEVLKKRKLPEAYCVRCAQERPEEFEFIRKAEAEGCIVFTGFCPKHAIEFFGSYGGVENARIEDGELRAEIGGRTFINDELLPESGMLWRDKC